MVDELLLWDLSDSPFCAKARIGLNLKAVPFRRVTLTLRRLPEMRRIAPLGKVPVLVQGSEVVADSSAILRHLEAMRPEPALFPADAAARAYCDLLEEWADESLYFVVGGFKWLNPANRATALARTADELVGGPLRPLLGRLVAARLVRRYRAAGYGPETLAHLEQRMRENLAMLATLLGDKPFLLGRTLTAADLSVFAQLAWMRAYVEGRLLDDVKVVRDWLARLEAVPAVSAALVA